MEISITPSPLSGSVVIPPSKSLAHRALIGAALAPGRSVIRHLQLSQDIKATMDCLGALGASFQVAEDQVVVTGITALPQGLVTLDCCESGSTLRFLIPIAAALGVPATFIGKGKLPTRPITPYLEEFPQKGVVFNYQNTMPFSISGQLAAGVYTIDGGISSQFITGLLFALPLLRGDSEICIKGRLESKPYVDLTIDMLARYHIHIDQTPTGYHIPGGQRYAPCDYTVEGDYSQAAFFLTAGVIGTPITCKGLSLDSKQGDRQIVSILSECGVKVTSCSDSITVEPAPLSPFDLDVRDIPDLVPILTVLGCFCNGTSYLRNAHRLRIKESDRLEAISQAINALGGQVTASEDELCIKGVGQLSGGKADSFQDHRIAMSVAVASIRCREPVFLTRAESVHKSYPEFYQDFEALGGKINVVNME